MDALRCARRSAVSLLIAAAVALPCGAAYADEGDQAPAGGTAVQVQAVQADAPADSSGQESAAGAGGGSAADEKQAERPCADESASGSQGEGPSDSSQASPSATADATVDSPQPAKAASVASVQAPSPAAAASVQRGWSEDSGQVRYYDADGSAHTGWLVDSTYKSYGLQRYWFGSDGLLAFSRLIDAADAGWWAYATEHGYVVRGRYADPSTGYVYLADNDGRLEDAGWVVSSSYGQGTQRYWVDAEAHAAKPGYSADGWAHYTKPEGYVVRGSYVAGGLVYLADNDGRLASADGWLVTSAYGQGLQRYYIDAGRHAAVVGYSSDGWAHYTTSAGYVLRGASSEGGELRWADNDGRLKMGGWLVTSAFGQGLQRYWMEGGSAARSRLIDAADAGWWAYATEYGYVVRGRYADPSTGYVYLADNDGRLENAGWVVSSSYGQGTQRYWVDAEAHAAKPGYSADGWSHYTTSAGYVLRGASSEGGSMRWADNDGRLMMGGWLVTSAFGQGTQRYWMEGGSAARSRLIDAADAGWWAYARPEGYVVRGSYAAGGLVYLADNDGRLASTDGWLVTSAYGQGLQRYYVYADRHAAVVGYSADGWAHYTTSWGYVACGITMDVDGSYYLADNDGRLSNVGWVISADYGQGMQRYYVDPASHRLRTGFFRVDSRWYYGTSNGYVLRGKMQVGSGMLLADNDGSLVENIASEGWLVTSLYDGGLQRYRIDYSCDGHLGAHLGYFTLGDNAYYGRYDTGYVVRNVVYTAPDGSMYYGDNDGVLQPLPSRFADMAGVAQGLWSRTGWLILVDRSQNRIAIYSGSQWNWSASMETYCVTGAPGTPTITGQYETTGYHMTNLTTDSRARWATQIYGGYFFHTILASESELGNNLSHGCVRLAEDVAYWIYCNIPAGTKVYIY